MARTLALYREAEIEEFFNVVYADIRCLFSPTEYTNILTMPTKGM